MNEVQEALARVPAAAKNVSSRLVDGVAIALTEGDQTLHTFDGPVSTHIWSLIDGRRTLGEILTEILASFEVDQAQASTDLLRFIQLLQDRGLIAVSDSTQGSPT